MLLIVPAAAFFFSFHPARHPSIPPNDVAMRDAGKEETRSFDSLGKNRPGSRQHNTPERSRCFMEKQAVIQGCCRNPMAFTGEGALYNRSTFVQQGGGLR